MRKSQSEKLDKKRDPGKTIEVLFKISEAVSNTRNLDELYKVIHKSLDKILNVDNFYIALHNEAKDTITFPYHVDENNEILEEIVNFSKKPSSTGILIQNRMPMIFYEEDIIRLASQFKNEAIGTVCKIWLGAPLIINNRVIGAIVIQDYHSSTAYQKEDLDLLNSVSQHIALAIERKESEEQLTEQRQVLEKILESSPVGIALIQDRIFKWVNNEMIQMFGYQSKLDLENKSTRIVYSDTDDFEIIGRQIYSALEEKGFAEYEIDLVKKDDALFPVHLKLSCGDP